MTGFLPRARAADLTAAAPAAERRAAPAAAFLAAPGIRFRWFLNQFGERSAFTSICNEDLSVAITAVGTVVRSAIIDFPTTPDTEVPEVDGGESTGCSVGAGTPGHGAGAVLLFALLALPLLRRARRGGSR